MFSRRLLRIVTTGAHYYKTATKTAGNNGSFAVLKEKRRSADILSAVLRQRRNWLAEDWIKARNDILSTKQFITEHSIDALILSYFTSLKDFQTAFSYVEFLHSQNIELNLATKGRYFKLFYAMHQNQSEPITKEHEQQILSLYEDLRKAYPILDSISLDSCIEGLSITKEWRKCLDLLEEIRICQLPSAAAYIAIVSAAFVNGEEDLAWRILMEMLEHDRIPTSQIFDAYLTYAEKKPGDRAEHMKAIEKLFNFFLANDIRIDSDLAGSIFNYANKFGLIAKTTNINPSGVCHQCKKKLKKHEITQNEFDDLKKKIIDNVIIGEDIFQKTMPEELNRFKLFLAAEHNYDVIIDGLNVAYSAGVDRDKRFSTFLVSSVVDHFLKQNKKSLVLGRQHMSKWPGFASIKQKADVFLTHNVSHDDPYLLYCGLSAGKDAIIVSRDLMRSHKFLLRHYQLKILFNRWLSDRLYQLRYVDKQGKATFKQPSPYSVAPQKIDKCWHIPYEVITNSSADFKETVIKWACITC